MLLLLKTPRVPQPLPFALWPGLGTLVMGNETATAMIDETERNRRDRRLEEDQTRTGRADAVIWTGENTVPLRCEHRLRPSHSSTMDWFNRIQTLHLCTTALRYMVPRVLSVLTHSIVLSMQHSRQIYSHSHTPLKSLNTAQVSILTMRLNGLPREHTGEHLFIIIHGDTRVTCMYGLQRPIGGSCAAALNLRVRSRGSKFTRWLR